MPNFIDDRHWSMLAYIGNKARAGKLKDVDITVKDVDLIITAVQRYERVIKELNATIAAQDKVMTYVNNAALAVMEERVTISTPSGDVETVRMVTRPAPE